jgi:hypothetical protein
MSAVVVEPVEELPAAKQLVVLGHDTPVRTLLVAPAGLGLAMMDQLGLMGSKRNTSVWFDEPPEPTAKQRDALRQFTPFRTPPPIGFGLATTDQLTPFQRSTSVWFDEPVKPTAKQLVVLTHDTPFKKL